MDRTRRTLVVVLVALHIALLAAYTFPQRLVPEVLRIFGQVYARPVFHQQWQLFAPDPPLCSCEVQLWLNGTDWRPLNAAGGGYLTHRTSRTIAWHVRSEVTAGLAAPSVRLQTAMRSMVRDLPREAPEPSFRLVQRCVPDPSQPAIQELRITPLEMR